MTKRLIISFSIFSLFLSTLIIPANAVAKAGTKCNKEELPLLYRARYIHALNLARSWFGVRGLL